MDYFAQQLINGLVLGSIYGLIAIGYTMVYGIVGMINFAHGDIFMIGGFIALITFLILVSIGLTVVPVILLIVLPYIGIFAYIFSQGRGMAERNQERARQAKEELRKAVGFSAADEIEKLDRLKAAGSISADEYGKLRARLVD